MGYRDVAMPRHRTQPRRPNETDGERVRTKPDQRCGSSALKPRRRTMNASGRSSKRCSVCSGMKSLDGQALRPRRSPKRDDTPGCRAHGRQARRWGRRHRRHLFDQEPTWHPLAPPNGNDRQCDTRALGPGRPIDYLRKPVTLRDLAIALGRVRSSMDSSSCCVPPPTDMTRVSISVSSEQPLSTPAQRKARTYDC
jgi:hypothetical protein